MSLVMMRMVLVVVLMLKYGRMMWLYVVGIAIRADFDAWLNVAWCSEP
jgi:hypothetical protein